MKFKIFATAILASFLLLFSCSDANDKNSPTGSLSVQLTDAPFLYDLVKEANVTIFKIDARYKGDVEMDTTGTSEGSFVVLMEDEIQVNLLELTNGITENLLNADVPVGTYDLIRVYVKGVNVVLNDETVYDLKVPSGAQTGIKVFVKPGIVVSGGLTSDLLLDFDVSKSFVAIGGHDNLSGFNFKPVIKASNLSTAGTLTGAVTTLVEETQVALEGAQVSVIVADTINTTTFTDVSGNYTIMGLSAGTYNVMVELEGYNAAAVEGVTIEAANKTVQDIELVLPE